MRHFCLNAHLASQPQLNERIVADDEALARELAAAIAAQLAAAVAERGEALLAVSGGRSPQRLFTLLAQAPLPWARITVTLVDERWVGPEHADSNARLLRDYLLVGAAAAARFVPLKNDAATPQQGLAVCEAAVRALPLPFDAVVLGMGDDGHTASLFPAAEGLAAALDADGAALCAAIVPPAAAHPRMTLTLAGLLRSRLLLLPLSGANKLAVYREARGAGPVETLPVRAVLRQTRVPVEVWCVGG